MRVLCTFGAAFDGGTLRVLADGLPLLKRSKGLEIQFMDLYGRPEVRARLEANGVPVLTIGSTRAPWTSLHSGFRRAFDRLCAVPGHLDIVRSVKQAARTVEVCYVHSFKELAIAHLATAGRARQAVVWHCHGIGESGLPAFGARVARRCDAIVAISSAVAQRLCESGVPKSIITTIPNAVDAGRIRAEAAKGPRSPLPPKRRPVVIVPSASIRPFKGPHCVTRAARMSQRFDVWITGDMNDTAGGEYLTELRRESEDLRTEGRVHFLGFRADIYAVMAAADVVCVPSLCPEGFGLVAAEAMALRKPVVVSNQGALPEVVGHGTAGVIVDPEDTNALTGALEALFGGGRALEALVADAECHVLRQFSYTRWANCISDVLCGATRVLRPGNSSN